MQRWPRSLLAAGKTSSSFLQRLLILRIKYLGLTTHSDPLIPPLTKHLESKSCNHFNPLLLCIPSAPASLKCFGVWFFFFFPSDLQQELRKRDIHTAAVCGNLSAESLLGEPNGCKQDNCSISLPQTPCIYAFGHHWSRGTADVGQPYLKWLRTMWLVPIAHRWGSLIHHCQQVALVD